MTSLSELCSICYVSLPRYTCPRCGCQTCSLECVKTHKKRAKCSGVRNPAAYKKSSELATPASIDQDYNFITRVQRDIDRADDDVAGRGITLVPARPGKYAHASKPKLEIEYQESNVNVVKAPTGLTRSRQNKTRWDNRHQCIVWTVEWVLQDNRRIVSNVQGNKNMLDAFKNSVGKKGLPRKRKHEDEEDAAAEEYEANEQSLVAAHLVTQGTTAAGMVEDPEQPTEQVASKEDAAQPSTADRISSQMHFFLHRPRTSSKWTCLIPISSSTTISDVLRDRTILEFPTIYARHDGTSQLQAPFITEQDYEEQRGIDVIPKLPVYGQEDPVTMIEHGPDLFHEKKVLEVLQKDLVG